MTEFELKFHGPADALASLRSALRQHGARSLRMRACYFDTPDGKLAAAGVALRLRQEGRRWTQTLKAPGGSAVERLEHELRLPAQPAAAARPKLDAARHDLSPAGIALRVALGDTPEAALIECLTTDVLRLRRVLYSGGTAIEVALDSGQVAAGAHSAALTELELELKFGPAEPLFELALAWAAHGGLWLSTLTKLERGVRLQMPGPIPATHAEPTPLPRAPDAATLLRAVLRSVLAQVLANAGDIADGSSHADNVHQLRVGLRRLRTALRELASLSPALDGSFDAPLVDVFSRLGVQRDQDAVADAVRPLLQAAGAPLPHWPAPPPVDVAAVVRTPAFQATLLRLLALAHAEADRYAPLAPDATRAFVAARLDRLHRRVTGAGQQFDRLPVEAQHRARKQLKRLRYLTEFVQAMWPRKAVDGYLARLKPAQEALGLHNDVAVATERFRAEAETDARAGFAAGYLQAYQATTARAAGKGLRAIDDKLRFWKD